jgi:hypothetical protein
LNLSAGKFNLTSRGIGRLMHGLGWSPPKPSRRAAERDEEAIATWAKVAAQRLPLQRPIDWPRAKKTLRD